MQLFRPITTRWETPDGTRCSPQTPGAVKRKEKSATWHVWWRDANGRERSRTTGETMKSKAAIVAARIVTEHADADDATTHHADRPLTRHLDDYAAHLRAKGDTPDHVRKTVSRIQAILDATRATHHLHLDAQTIQLTLARWREPHEIVLPPEPWLRPRDIAALLGWHPHSLARTARRLGITGQGHGRARRYSRRDAERLADIARRGTGATSSNAYLLAIKGFTRWLGPDGEAGRFDADPLRRMKPINARPGVRVKRRPLTPAETTRLLSETLAGPAYRGLSGADRHAIYSLALGSGLRASELASLRPGSFHWQSGTVVVEAAYSKRRRQDVQPLPRGVLDLMRRYLEGRPPTTLIWPGTWHLRAAEMIGNDLRRADIPVIVEGRQIDFHALRHTYISSMVSAGVDPKTVQILARHSTITLTMDRYSHTSTPSVDAALDALDAIEGATKGGNQNRNGHKRPKSTGKKRNRAGDS